MKLNLNSRSTWIVAVIGAITLGGAIGLGTAHHTDVVTPLVPTVSPWSAVPVPTLTPWTKPASATAVPAPVTADPRDLVTEPVGPPASSSSGPGRFLCHDGTISRAEHRQGACSRHGGIAG